MQNKIDHRNIRRNISNLGNILTQYKNPRIEQTEEENDDTDFAKIETDDDNNVIEIVSIT